MNKINQDICLKCICDYTFPNISFNKNGICNYCDLHNLLEKELPNGNKGQAIIQKRLKSIKKRNGNSKYDCIIGISGGGDSIYTLWLCAKKYNLRVLAVHFNSGFGNPIAGENMTKATNILGVDFEVVTSDWKETRALNIALLKSSTPDLALANDIGFTAALFSSANKHNVKDIIIGQSWRTEGISPSKWSYYDGEYLKDIIRRLCDISIRKWAPNDAGYNLGISELIYYIFLKRIRSSSLLYYEDYNRQKARALISKELNWQDTGAHYYDDLYQVLFTIYLKEKFDIDRRKFNYSALIRSNQLERKDALKKINDKDYPLFDEKILSLCLQRLEIDKNFFTKCIKSENKFYYNYFTIKKILIFFKPLVWLMVKLGMILQTTYLKYYKI